MCRDKDHGGRRCPGDTSAKRALRKRSAAARKKAGEVGASIAPRDMGGAQFEKTDINQDAAISPLEALKAKAQDLMARIKKEAQGAPYSMGDGDKLLAPTIELGQVLSDLADECEKEARDDFRQSISLEQYRLADSCLEALNTVESHIVLNRRGGEEVATLADMWGESICSTLGLEIPAATTVKEARVYWRKVKEHWDSASDTLDRYLGSRERYRDALSRVGVEFNQDNPRVSANIRSDKKALRMLNTASVVFPRSWIQASDESEIELKVSHTKGRATYGHAAIVESTEALKARGSNKTRANMVAPTKTIEDSIYADEDGNPITYFESRFGVDSVMGRASRAVITQADIDRGWYEDDYGFKFSLYAFAGRTLDRGFLEIELPVAFKLSTSSVFLVDAPRGYRYIGDDEDDRQVFYKPHGQREKHLAAQAGEKTKLAVVQTLAVSGDEDSGVSTAAHEMSHRIERVVPEIAAAERSFLHYRARASNDGKLPDMTTVKTFGTARQKAEEIGYPDNFYKPYSGRVYEGGEREILSMGIEQLFFGEYGGFEGKARDDEYRNFILGLIARSAMES